MGRGKGPKGITCAQAIRDVLSKEKIISSEDLFKAVKKTGQGAWTNDHIWQEIMSRAVNLLPSYGHWSSVEDKERFIFLHEDGQCQLYDSSIHGKWSEGKRAK